MPASLDRRPRAPVARIGTLVALAALVACGGNDGPAAPTVASLRVFNATGRPVTAIYYQRCANPSWGPNVLAGLGPLANGSTYGIDSIPSGCYDLRADTDDGRRATRFQQNLPAGQAFEWRLELVEFRAVPQLR